MNSIFSDITFIATSRVVQLERECASLRQQLATEKAAVCSWRNAYENVCRSFESHRSQHAALVEKVRESRDTNEEHFKQAERALKIAKRALGSVDHVELPGDEE